MQGLGAQPRAGGRLSMSGPPAEPSPAGSGPASGHLDRVRWSLSPTQGWRGRTRGVVRGQLHPMRAAPAGRRRDVRPNGPSFSRHGWRGGCPGDAAPGCWLGRTLGVPILQDGQCRTICIFDALFITQPLLVRLVMSLSPPMGTCRTKRDSFVRAQGREPGLLGPVPGSGREMGV